MDMVQHRRMEWKKNKKWRKIYYLALFPASSPWPLSRKIHVVTR